MTLISDKVQIKEDTYRIIYQSYQDRNNQLSALNHAAVGFTVAFLAAMITAYATVDCQFKGQILPLIVFASILELTLWRVYAYKIDSSIVDCYEKIICCEDELGISNDKRLSLRKNLEESSLFLDRGHTIIDIVTYTIVVSIFSFYWVNSCDKIFCKLVLIIIILFTFCWVLCLKIRKCKKLKNLLNKKSECIEDQDNCFMFLFIAIVVILIILSFFWKCITK
ncbi:MAG: hypothetical protein LUQ04_05425 [Methanoregula sp.]|nr:hypothetical protein [Methanoregula sp.]